MLRRSTAVLTLHHGRIQRTSHARRFSDGGVNITKEGHIDIGYMLSLLDRPKDTPMRQAPSMIPESWPDVSIKGHILKYYSDSRTGKYLLAKENGKFENNVVLNNDNSRMIMTPPSWFDWPKKEEPDIFVSVNFNRPSCTDKDDARVAYMKKSVPETFSQVLEEELGMRNGQGEDASNEMMENPIEFEHLKKLVDSMRLNMFSPSIKQRDIYIGEVLDIEFGNLKSKNICTVLAKAFGFEEDPALVEKDVNSDDACKALNRTFLDSADNSLGNKTLKDASLHKGMLKKRLVISGADLHLVEYAQLRKIAMLYGIIESTSTSRSLLERAICKHINRDSDAKMERIECRYLADEGVVKAFIKGSNKSATTVGEWSEMEDEKLLGWVERISDIRQMIIKQVDDYLQSNSEPHNMLTPTSAASYEDINFWEVIAKNFDGRTAKNCKKRWVILHRMNSMAVHN